ncbi:lipoyl synthase, partial [bacterium]|nr:lipoyl synthase [bacterium]
AGCPNICECFGRSTATFMILGDRCTRNCAFCGVSKGNPLPLDPGEPERVAEAVRRLGLTHAVVTSVTRDDLPDGGSRQFVRTARAIRDASPGVTIELLVPDFLGLEQALLQVLDGNPDILGHNLETVPRLYTRMRSGADFERSVRLLQRSKKHRPDIRLKTGLMLGLGETEGELMDLFGLLSGIPCDALTLGQYLPPRRTSPEPERFVSPALFEFYRQAALSTGIPMVQAGPYVRSSYHAEEMMTACSRGDCA